MKQVITGLRGFSFNGIHNEQMKVVMNSRIIQSPAKKKIKDSVPFMNGSYDFSTVGSNGEIVYSERQITINIGIPAETNEELQLVYSNLLNWLVDTGKHELIFDDLDDYYFLGEVESATKLSEVMEYGSFEVTITADPFKKSKEYVGSDIWDTFNFEEDYVQTNTYAISGSKSITMNNPGRTVRPLINCTATMTLVKDGKTYNLAKGNNNIYGLDFKTGVNTMTVSGTGTIKILFRKESI
jgi:predicted phage tail component-like protein